MSVFAAVHLDCNGKGCTARFVPVRASETTALVREQADAAGWLVNFRGRGDDYCPTCADTPLGDYRTPRGICGVCGVERPVTLQALVKAHNAPGARRLCDGGGRPPSRLVRTHGAPTDHDWRNPAPAQRGGGQRA